MPATALEFLSRALVADRWDVQSYDSTITVSGKKGEATITQEPQPPESKFGRWRVEIPALRVAAAVDYALSDEVLAASSDEIRENLGLFNEFETFRKGPFRRIQEFIRPLGRPGKRAPAAEATPHLKWWKGIRFGHLRPGWDVAFRHHGWLWRTDGMRIVGLEDRGEDYGSVVSTEEEAAKKNVKVTFAGSLDYIDAWRKRVEAGSFHLDVDSFARGLRAVIAATENKEVPPIRFSFRNAEVMSAYLEASRVAGGEAWWEVPVVQASWFKDVSLPFNPFFLQDTLRAASDTVEVFPEIWKGTSLTWGFASDYYWHLLLPMGTREELEAEVERHRREISPEFS